MDDGKKTKKELLDELAEVRRRLAAAERDCQVIVEGLQQERQEADAQWQRQVEDLEGKLAEYAAAGKASLSEVEEHDSERERLLTLVQEQTEELQTANEELNVQTEELQAANEELTIQTEELHVANEELVVLNELLESQKQELEHLARDLETEQALLTAILEQMPASVVVIVKAPAGPIILSNHWAERTWGRPLASSEDLENFWRVPRYTRDGRVCEKENQPLWRSLTLGEVVVDEELSLRPEGRPPIHLSVSSAPVRDNHGSIVAGIVTHFDITGRKRSEERVLASEARYRQLVQLSPDAIIVHTDGKIVFLNMAAAKLLGADTFNDLLGRPIIDLVHPDGRDLVTQRIQLALQGGRAPLQELQLLRIDGQAVEVESAASGIVFQGQPSVQAVIRDVTARKQAEEALKESEERYRSIFENSHAVMVLLDPETGVIVDANPAACGYYGYSREELKARKVTDLNTLPQKRVFAEMQKARERQQEHFYFRHRLASGEVRDVEVFSSSIRIKKQDLLYSIIHDITARKQAEEALRQARDELELRVAERTADLRDTVAQLLEEVQERQLAQEALRKQAELLELAHEAIIVRDLDSRVIFWNPSATEKYGWTREEALGRVSHELLATRFSTPRTEVDRELVKTGHWQGELVHTRADGKEIIVSSRQAVQRDEHGQPVAILEMNRNVTARRQAEEALAAERQRLLALLERIPAYVALLRSDRTIAYANAEFIRRFGEPAGKYCYELKGLRDACTECEAMAVFHTGKPVVRERAAFDGSFYQIYDYPFMDVDGSPLVLEMGVDITARQRAEEQALSLGRMYRMVSKVNEAMVRIGADKDRLFKQVCQIMMEEGDFLLAWIGLVNRETRQVEAATEYNLDDDYIQNLTIPYDDVPEGRGPTGTAVREGRYDVCNDYAAEPRMDPWRANALARGFQSSAAFPLRVGSRVLGALTVYADRPGFFTAAEIELMESLADDISYALDFMDKDDKRHEAEAALRESEERLRYLASQLLHTQEHERRRLAMELHDDLGQSLMVLKLQMRAIEKMVTQDQWQIREECAHCLNYLNSVIDNVRRLSRDLRPAVLEDLGLSSGLRLLAGDFSTYHEVELSMEIADIEGLFTQEEEINIYRIFQETLTNIAKHAAADQIELVIVRDHEAVNFQVRDNGVGFDLEQVLARDPDKKGLGLAALEERVHMLGGELTIESQKNQGTQISIRVPIRSNRKTE